MSEWEPVCEPGGSGGGYRAGWQHLTTDYQVTLCGKPIDRERWKRWGITYQQGSLQTIVIAGRLCSECCEASWKTTGARWEGGGVRIDEFLLARIAEDEAAAREATAGEWYWEPPSNETWPEQDESLVARREPVEESEGVLVAWGYDAYGIEASEGDRAHIVRWQPSRVLAECAAKRAVVELHGRAHECSVYHHGGVDSGHWCVDPDDCSTLQVLAAVYADHPDYRDDWRV